MKKSKGRRKTKFLRILNIFIDGLKESDITGTAAQIAYYLIVSIFPFIIFFLNILSRTPIADEEVLENMLLILPDQAQAIFKGFISEIVVSSSDTLLSLSVLLILWSGSRGIYAIIKAVNRAYGTEQSYANIKFKILSLGFTVALSGLIIIVLAMLVFGEIIGSKIFTYFNATKVFLKIWNILRIIIPLVSMIVMFALLYKFSLSGNKDFTVSLTETLPGATFTTIGWLLYSFVFSFYVNNFASYSATYGSLGGVIILLLWLYMSSMLIVIGGEINGAYKKYKIIYEK